MNYFKVEVDQSWSEKSPETQTVDATFQRVAINTFKRQWSNCIDQRELDYSISENGWYNTYYNSHNCSSISVYLFYGSKKNLLEFINGLTS